MKTTLKDLIPENAGFTLRSTKKTHRLRAMTLKDVAWYQRTFGKTPDDLMENADFDMICKAIYFQLEDREDFLGRKGVTVIDENGYEEKRDISGVEKFQEAISVDEIDIMMSAFLKAMGVSEDDVKKVAEGKDKKKQKPTPKIGKK